MSSSTKELDVIKQQSGASAALGKSRNDVLGATNSKNKVSNEIAGNTKKTATNEITKKVSKEARIKSSTNTSSKAKKSNANEQAKKRPPSNSPKEKVRSQPKRQQPDVCYAEKLEERPKKTKVQKSIPVDPKFILMDDMRVGVNDRIGRRARFFNSQKARREGHGQGVEGCAGAD